MTDDPFAARFDSLIAFIEKAIADARAGTITDMQEMEKTIAALCKDLEKAGPEAAQSAQGHMARMISRLDELAQMLIEHKMDFEDKYKDED